MKRYAKGGMSADVEADLQALKTLEQPDYYVGGPKRRYPAGKVKRYEDEVGSDESKTKKPKSTADRVKATAFKALNRTVGRVAQLPFYAIEKMFPDDEQYKSALQKTRKQNEQREEGAYFKKGGSVSSASKRADGCATKGKTRGKFV